MVVLKNPDDYKFLMFVDSGTKNKKYDAILMHKQTKKLKLISFGNDTYQHYRDKTGLKLYSHLDHLDHKRRERYRRRHDGEQKNKYSSGYFSYYYLW